MDPAHKKHLQRLWLKLLENITHYQGIVDGLFAEGILTGPLKQRVLQKNGDDQLREILDILPRRGPNAFSVFYKVLVHCGEDVAADLLCPELAAQRIAQQAKLCVPVSGVQESRQVTVQSLAEDDELPEKWPDIGSHDPFKVNVINVAENDWLMRSHFERAADGKGAVYCMHRPVRGIFLLLSNQYFKEARANEVVLADRDGTGKDCIALDNLFQQFGFLVIKKFNLNAQEMLEAIQAQASEDHTNYNCFVCAVLTHGERDIVYGVDGKTISLDDLKNSVDGDNCPTLIGKPKLFFIQACQGKTYDKGSGAVGGFGEAGPNLQSASVEKDIDMATNKFVNLTVRDNMESDSVTEGRVSSKSDVFVAMATVPDYVSWRNTEWGTWFIQAVVYVFSHLAHKYDLMQLMTRVNRLVSKAETRTGCKQVSIFKSALTGEFYFFPGLQRELVTSHSETDMAGSSGQSQKAPSTVQQTANVQTSVPQQPTAEQQASAAVSMGSGLTAQPSDSVDGTLVE